MAVSKYLEMLIGGSEPPDNEPPADQYPDPIEAQEMTPEKEEILDYLEKSWLTTKFIVGFAIKKLSKSPQKAIELPGRFDNMSDYS
ncbi:MAG: hypothetical protein WCD53_15295 [Microcoleus sp.]